MPNARNSGIKWTDVPLYHESDSVMSIRYRKVKVKTIHAPMHAVKWYQVVLKEKKKWKPNSKIMRKGGRFRKAFPEFLTENDPVFLGEAISKESRLDHPESQTEREKGQEILGTELLE